MRSILIFIFAISVALSAQELLPSEIYELGQLRQATADLQKSWEAERRRLEAEASRLEAEAREIVEDGKEIHNQEVVEEAKLSQAEELLADLEGKLAALAPQGVDDFLQQIQEQAVAADEIRFREDVLKDATGVLREFEILEIGLGLKLAVNRATGQAGVCEAGNHSQWQWNNAWAENIAQAVDVFNLKLPPQVVELPFIVGEVSQ